MSQQPATETKKTQKKKFALNHKYSLSKIKSNIKRTIRSNERFAGNIPSLFDQTTNSLATMIIELAEKISTTASECSKKVSKQTINCDDIFAAVSIELNGELLAHCNAYMKQELAKSNVQKK